MLLLLLPLLLVVLLVEVTLTSSVENDAYPNDGEQRHEIQSSNGSEKRFLMVQEPARFCCSPSPCRMKPLDIIILDEEEGRVPSDQGPQNLNRRKSTHQAIDFAKRVV